MENNILGEEKKIRFIVLLLSIILPLFVLVTILLPEISHYYEPTYNINAESVRLMRKNPTSIILSEIEDHQLGLIETEDKDIITIADNMLKGKLKIKSMPVYEININYIEDDIDKNGPRYQLLYASLFIPNILLDAYIKTNKEKYYKTAKYFIISWSRYEKNAWLPKGFMWDDHAISARASVYIKFWHLYRTHAEYDENEANEIIESISRLLGFLARPDHFTVSTNHGMMQNLAILQIAISFPELPNINDYIKIAFERISEQMNFYINAEGVVLEHSAEYHEMGLIFLSLAMRYMSLLNIDIPKVWIDKYNRAKLFYAMLLRPDNTLPMIGDTTNAARKPIRLAFYDKNRGQFYLKTKGSWVPNTATGIYPAAGYAILWNGLENWPDKNKLSQLVITWSDFISQAHKHKDELSIQFWGAGHTWWTNVGYWPYGEKYRLNAISWLGSNAPHFEHELSSLKYDVNLMSHGNNQIIRFFDIQRIISHGSYVRRQFIQLYDDYWIILDTSADDKNRNTLQNWTTTPATKIKHSSNKNTYNLYREDSDTNVDIVFFGQNKIEVNLINGSNEPFGGWFVTGISQKPIETNAFRLKVPANIWSAIIWKLKRGDSGKNTLVGSKMLDWTDESKWILSISSEDNKEYLVERNDSEIVVRKKGHDTNIVMNKIQLSRSPINIPDAIMAESAFINASNRYKEVRDIYPYRIKVSLFILILMLFQEVSLFFYKKLVNSSIILPRTVTVIAWFFLGAWINLFYLNV